MFSPLIFLATGIGPSIDSLAGDWIASYAVHPEDFRGTLTQLQAYIADSANQCGTYVHTENKLHNTANGTSACKTKLNYLYQQKLMELEGQQKQQIDNLRLWASQNSMIVYAAVAAILIILLIIFL
ncbi:MAG: hypothetical protein EBX41_00810 [Chitinophagia bacterium]|nr:hypothetical protein [Chitinophagia bacterium]